MRELSGRAGVITGPGVGTGGATIVVPAAPPPQPTATEQIIGSLEGIHRIAKAHHDRLGGKIDTLLGTEPKPAAVSMSTEPAETNNHIDAIRALLGAIEAVQTATLHELERLERL